MTPCRALKFLVLIAAFYTASFWLLYYYTDGDQGGYHRFYDALQSAAPSEVMDLARAYVSSTEPVSAYILWLGAKLDIPKNLFTSTINVFFLFALYLLVEKSRPPWFIYFLLYSNFYLVVLLTSAERLKISFLILAISALVSTKYKPIFLLSSVLAHFQTGIFLFSLYCSDKARDVRSFLCKLKISKQALYLNAALMPLLASFLALTFALSNVTNKYESYSRYDRPISELINISLLLMVATLVTRDRFRILASMAPLVLAVYVLGGQRVNMIAFCVVFFLLLQENRLTSFYFVLLMSYLSVKTIPFVLNIYRYGNGWGGWLL